MWLRLCDYDLGIFHFIIDEAWIGAIIRKEFLEKMNSTLLSSSKTRNICSASEGLFSIDCNTVFLNSRWRYITRDSPNIKNIIDRNFPNKERKI